MAPNPQALLPVLNFLFDWGWIAAPLFLFLVWRSVWFLYVQKAYAESQEWMTLELKIPSLVERTPKAMEQVFAGLHSIKSSANFKEKWWDGKHQLHISMEIVGINGAIHFLIKTPAQYRRLIESQIYSQYKDCEIEEVEDYAWSLPDDIPNEQYDLWGTELIFTKEDAYPIRTYRFFEEPASEKKFIDPLASLMEVLGELKEGEQIWVQYLIKPTGDEWQKEGQKLVDKLIGRKSAKKSGDNVAEEIYQFFYDLIGVLFGRVPTGSSANGADEKEKPETMMQHLSPGMKETVAALEESISKHGFKSGIRILYIARADVFSKASIPAALGAFKQFSTYNLNGFKPNGQVTPSVDYLFKKTREYIRKRRLYTRARIRFFVSKGIIFNTEELATVYHIPSVVLEAPKLPKITAKKAEPPKALPTI